MSQDESSYSSDSFLPPARENERRHVIDRFFFKLKEMVRDEVECKVCFNVFETGKGSASLLECGHILCNRCYIEDVFINVLPAKPVKCPFCSDIMRLVVTLRIPEPAPRVLIRQSSIPPSSTLTASASGLLDLLSDDPAHAHASEDGPPASADAAEDDPPAPTDAAEDDPPARTDAAEDDEPADDDDDDGGGGNAAD